MEIFLEENKSVLSNNVGNSINVELSNDVNVLPNDSLSETLSLFEEYNNERNKCNDFRIIVNVNPVCSNILFNMKTEIVKDEGSDNCKVIYDINNVGPILRKDCGADESYNTTDPITYRHAIRDAEYTNQECGNFVYHCGIDIFNNHMIRANNFVHVNGMSDASKELSKTKFNTIEDYLRDGQGNIIEDEIGRTYREKKQMTQMHLYEYDTIESMKESFLTKCKEKEGWWGFTNPGNMEIPNSINKEEEGKTINRMMAKNKACEFIDLYPDRSLFSFVPKYNKFRKRLENNWDYCLTYPYAKDENKINVICSGETGAIRANVKKIFNGTERLQCSSYFKHNLKVGDFVRFYYYIANGEDKIFQKYTPKVKVVSLGDSNGDSKDKIFSVKLYDIESIYENMLKNGCFYKKISGGDECSYYFRKFKKITKLSYDADGEVIENNLLSDINKIAFGETIYGDDLAQIIFTDDVNVDGLVDYYGKPITEIYLTIIKGNKGYNKWYQKTSSKEKEDYSQFKGEDVEFSHCFGKVTSGLDFSGIEDEPFQYNIHYMHNIPLKPLNEVTDSWGNTLSAWERTILSGTPETLENDLTIDNEIFYGDIVEFDHSTSNETIISKVYHRVNTMQREAVNNAYKDIYEDKIVSDDYDVEIEGKGKTGFKVETTKINTSKIEGKTIEFHGNIMPEGYYYNPHYRIAIKGRSKTTTYSEAKIVGYNEFSFTTESKVYKVTLSTTTNYGFYKGDYIAMFNIKTQDIAWGEIVKVVDNKVTISLNISDIKIDNGVRMSDAFSPTSINRVYYAFWSPNNVPTYATLSFSSMRFSWNKIVPYSEMERDDELYDTTFANGRFYLENNINFFLRRQDPFGKYGLSYPIIVEDIPYIDNKMTQFSINDRGPIDLSNARYIIDNLTNECY